MARIRVRSDGELEVVDPRLEDVELLRSIDPGFQVRTAPLPGFTRPRVLSVNACGSGLSVDQLGTMPTFELWERHAIGLAAVKSSVSVRTAGVGEAALMGVKVELASRLLEGCALCGHHCGVNRRAGERGVCRLGVEGVVGARFIHVGEEAEINPSSLVLLTGCGLRCRACQQGHLLDPDRVKGDRLDGGLWRDLAVAGARSVSFLGGNPDESLPAILRCMSAIPGDWTLPVVWNCNGYSSPETLELLDGVVDVFLPDFKYGDSGCAGRLSGVQHYPATARLSILAMLHQGVRVIVRVLVLPGHNRCCHVPVLETLAVMGRRHENLVVSIRDQYAPGHLVTVEDGDLARRPTPDEVKEVTDHAQALGLRTVG